MPTKGLLYYTDSRLDEKIAQPVRDQLETIGLPVVSVSLKPLDFGLNIHLKLTRGYLTMFKQILVGLEASAADIIYMVEHDVLYPKEHFQFTPMRNDRFYYDLNWYKVHSDGVALRWSAAQVSGLCAYRELLVDYYKRRIANFDPDNFDRKFEPAGFEGALETWEADRCHVDIRHRRNLTYNKRGLADFRDKTKAINFQEVKIEEIPGWNLTTKDIYG